MYCRALAIKGSIKDVVFLACINKSKILSALELTGMQEKIEFAMVDRNGKVILKSENFDTSLMGKNPMTLFTAILQLWTFNMCISTSAQRTYRKCTVCNYSVCSAFGAYRAYKLRTCKLAYRENEEINSCCFR